MVMEHFLVYCSQVGLGPTVEAETQVRVWICLSLMSNRHLPACLSVMMAGDLRAIRRWCVCSRTWSLTLPRATVCGNTGR